ncbi:MAG: hypothetical protein ACOC9X_01700 [bacterium]
MKRLSVGDPAPEFTLTDQQGKSFTLSELYRTQNVLLVFNLGFV